jgi:hypothetical protein
MANYMCYSRTNSFKVTDSDKFKELIGRIACEDDVKVWPGLDGTFSLGAYGNITSYYDEDKDRYFDIFDELQKLLPDGEAAIFFEVGYEKLRYLVGQVSVVTNKAVRFSNIEQEAFNILKELGIKEPEDVWS